MREMLRMKTRGQAMLLVGIMVGLGVLFGFVALATDGGSALLQRRNMQNGADAAALGDVKALQASIILNNGVPSYSMTNADVATRTLQLLVGNRGGTTGNPSYTANVEYGHFVTATQTYTWTGISKYTGSSWTYDPSYPSTTFAPPWLDAVRITAGIDNPTTFAKVIGISTVNVQAKAAAAMQNVAGFIPQGPTWPMTQFAASPTPDPGSGWCNPELFWSNAGSQNFRNVLQLGGSKGMSYENSTANNFSPQLIHAHDERQVLADTTGVNLNQCQNKAGFAGTAGLWSPAGNCTATTTCPTCATHNNVCCDTNNNAVSSDIPNWITYLWTGRLSTTEHWDSSAFNSYPASDTNGDWPEVYNAGNLGQNIALPLQNYIQAHGQTDAFSQWYGLYVDQVMYTFDRGQEWTQVPRGDPLCDPITGVCPYKWQEVDVQRRAPQRVHVNQAVVFRFYYMLAGSHGNVAKPTLCGGGTVSTSNNEVFGVYVGQAVNDPPPGPGGHGIYNYLSFIDPNG